MLEDGWPASKRQDISRVKINEYLPALQTKAVVLNDRHGVLCASYWMQINTSCRPDVAPTSGFEHGVTRRNFYHYLVEEDRPLPLPQQTLGRGVLLERPMSDKAMLGTSNYPQKRMNFI